MKKSFNIDLSCGKINAHSNTLGKKYFNARIFNLKFQSNFNLKKPNI